MKSLMDMVNNKEFIEKMASSKGAEDLKALFDQEGLELEDGLSYEQAYTILQHAANDELSDDEKAQLASMDTELSEDELENVSGGFSLGAAIGVGVLIYFGYKYIKGVFRALNECR